MNRYERELLEFEEETSFLLSKAVARNAFIRVLQNIVNELGFSFFDITHTRQKLNLNNALSSFPRKCSEIYYNEVDCRNNIVTKIVFSSEVAIYSSDILSAFSTLPKDSKDIKNALIGDEVMRGLGFSDTFCIPLLSSGSSGKIFFSVFPGESGSIDFKKLVAERFSKINILRDIVTVCIDKNIFYSRSDLLPYPELDDVDILILKHLGIDSMKIKEIAQEIGKTESYIHSSIRKSKNALNKQTTAGAVVEALRLEIIN